LDGGAISNAAVAPPYRPLAAAGADERHHPACSRALPTPRTRSACIAARRHGLLAAFDQATLATSPMGDHPRAFNDLSAPMNRWDIWASFESQTACEKENARIRDEAPLRIKFAHERPDQDRNGNIVAVAQAWQLAECVATDDSASKGTESPYFQRTSFVVDAAEPRPTPAKDIRRVILHLQQALYWP